MENELAERVPRRGPVVRPSAAGAPLPRCCRSSPPPSLVCVRALPAGEPGSRESFVATGSIIERDGVFHMFYPGHNPAYFGTDTPQQVILHATSSDLRTWTRDPDFEFYAPEQYEKHSWGDPFVFFNEERDEYWMLITARRTFGPKYNRGLTALAVSPDLRTWELRDPLWTPDMYVDIECPDLFRMGNWWYLVYSGTLSCPLTCYRMSHSPNGPWLAAANNTLDGHMYYAAKTCSDGNARFAFGWILHREGETDDGKFDYAGSLVVHEIVQQPDGTLAVRMPESVAAAFAQSVALKPEPILGRWRTGGDEIGAEAWARYSALTLGPMPDECLIDTRISFAEGTACCGLLLRADETLDNYYQVRLEPGRQRVTTRRLPRRMDEPMIPERPLTLVPGQPVRLRAIADGTCLVVYANDQVALTDRMYDHRVGALGVFVADGQASFSGVSLKRRTDNG